VPAVAPLLDSPRARALIERSARRALAAVGVSDVQPAVPVTDVPAPEPCIAAVVDAPAAILAEQFVRELRPAHLASEQASVTNALFERLDEQDVAEVEDRIRASPELSASYAHSADERVRRHLILSFGVHLGVESVLSRTGLSQQVPPEDVHAMSRGPLAAAGGLYEADIVADALASAGIDAASVRTGLDFGCSSGRVVRALAAAYPQAHWHGCDPNGAAISWATENLRGVEFFANDDEPPLPLADASLDLVYAISIWSHFEPALGLRWFEEMRRVLRPGGHLVCTTHGLVSVAFYATLALRTPEQSLEIAEALYRRGWWYAPEFGEEGDWGVVNPDWGTAFISPEWMLAQLCPHWRVLEFAPGRNQDNQDVYLLERV
jgi:SAM-dependent methyltransferase